AACPLENIRILSKEESKAWHAEQRQLEKERAERDAERAQRRASRYGGKPRPEPRRPRPRQPPQDGHGASKEGTIAADLPPDAPPNAADATGQPVSRGYGNAVTGGQPRPSAEAAASGDTPGSPPGSSPGSCSEGAPGGPKKRRRRR